MDSSQYKILQLTDMHLFEDHEERLLGVNTRETFERVFEDALINCPNPDMICLTGDISQDETIPAYEWIAERLKAYHCPKYWVPGNHDDIDYIETVFPEFHIQMVKHMVLEHWQVIMLDTKKLNAVEGHITDDQLELLETALSTYPEHPALIFMHHHPIPVGSQWLDNLMLLNANEFWDVVNVYNNVKLIVCGHVHQEFHSKMNNIEFYSTPSTCFQFRPKSASFGVDQTLPGYRVIELESNGTFKTKVNRIENYTMTVDGRLTGY